MVWSKSRQCNETVKKDDLNPNEKQISTTSFNLHKQSNLTYLDAYHQTYYSNLYAIQPWHEILGEHTELDYEVQKMTSLEGNLKYHDIALQRYPTWSYETVTMRKSAKFRG